jgi:hypothetical protein
MSAILWWLSQNAVATAFLIPLAVLFSRIFRSRPAAQHAVWVIVLVKFITPPVVSWPLSLQELWPSLALSAGLPRGEPAPVLGISAGRSSAFERRLTMVLSDRVSGTMSARGIFTAMVLALAALPGWSFGQKPATDPTQVDVQAGADQESTTARLQQIEAELKRLAALVEHSADSDGPKSASVRGDNPEQSMLWRKYKGIVNNSAATFESDARKYTALALEKTIQFYGSDKEGREIWRSHLASSLPGRLAGGYWAVLRESDDRKQVIFTWTAGGNEHMFRFDTATGKLLSHDVRKNVHDTRYGTITGLPEAQSTSQPLAEKANDEGAIARLAALGYFNKERPAKSGPTKKIEPPIYFGRGQNRIYILNTEKNAVNECFLVAQTNQAKPLWRTTFLNPLFTDHFRQARRAVSPDASPNDGLTGDWTIEESEDAKLVIVNCTSNSPRVKLVFDRDSGKLLTEDFMPKRSPK